MAWRSSRSPMDRRALACGTLAKRTSLAAHLPEAGGGMRAELLLGLDEAVAARDAVGVVGRGGGHEADNKRRVEVVGI